MIAINVSAFVVCIFAAYAFGVLTGKKKYK